MKEFEPLSRNGSCRSFPRPSNSNPTGSNPTGSNPPSSNPSGSNPLVFNPLGSNPPGASQHRVQLENQFPGSGFNTPNNQGRMDSRLNKEPRSFKSGQTGDSRHLFDPGSDLERRDDLQDKNGAQTEHINR